jgi:hypothetical protein
VLTIFTIPKPFTGHVGVIQRNAIRSWLALRPRCEVILFGDDGGVAECALDLGVEHVGGVPCTDQGTPLLHEIFAIAERAARFPRLCFVNADILLPPEFADCAQRIDFPKFLMIGRRLDLDVADEFELDEVSRSATFWAMAAASGTPHPAKGSDYFVFPKGSIGSLPPFAVGRPGWDNWMIFRAREVGIPLVDASGCVTVVHQNHGYGHVPQGTGELWEGPEAERNRALVCAAAQSFTPRFATWHLEADGLHRRPWWARDRASLMHEWRVLHPWSRPLLPVADSVLRLSGRARSRVRSAPPVGGAQAPTGQAAMRGSSGLAEALLRSTWPQSRHSGWMARGYVPGLISVIVPAHDRAAVVVESLESVAAQTYRPIELIVVDDGSSDGTSREVEQWSNTRASDPGLTVRLVRQGNHGAADARNHGLIESRGEYVQFLDSDDLLHPEKLDRHAAVLAADPDIDYVYSGTGSFAEAPVWDVTPFAGRPPSDDRMLLRFLQGGLWNTISGVYRRSACFAVGPWDERAPIFQDWDYNVRFLLGGPSVRYVEGVLSLRRSGAGDRVTAGSGSEAALRARFEQAVRWASWTRAAGRMDADVDATLATRALGAGWLALAHGYVGLSREVAARVRSAPLRGGARRSQCVFSGLVRLPRAWGVRAAGAWLASDRPRSH